MESSENPKCPEFIEYMHSISDKISFKRSKENMHFNEWKVTLGSAILGHYRQGIKEDWREYAGIIPGYINKSILETNHPAFVSSNPLSINLLYDFSKESGLIERIDGHSDIPF